MKLKYLVAPLLFAAAAATGCQESAETYPAIYMTDAQNNPDKSMTIDEPPAETSITVSSSVVMEHDVRIQLEVRPELLAAYNDKYGKNYQIPPEESYALSSTETTILAGYNTSSAIDFTVSSVSEFAEGVTYCVPVGIKTVSGGISVLEPSRTLFIVLKTPVISKAIYLGSSNIYKVTSFQENSDLAALPQLTLEARVYMLGFQTRDPYISSIMGIEGICGVRFGDVKVDPDCIQICHDSYQPAATDKPFDKEKWYHVAAVWTGSSWDIYINGQYATGVETQGDHRPDERQFGRFLPGSLLWRRPYAERLCRRVPRMDTRPLAIRDRQQHELCRPHVRRAARLLAHERLGAQRQRFRQYRARPHGPWLRCRRRQLQPDDDGHQVELVRL